MTTPGSDQTSARRALPAARSANKQYEIVFQRRSAGPSLVAGFFSALREGFGWAADRAYDAYAAGARGVIDRKEALEDRVAERRDRARRGAAESGSANPSVPER